jgi:hypothetical protein
MFTNPQQQQQRNNSPQYPPPGYPPQENPQSVYQQFPYQNPYPGTIPQARPQVKPKKKKISTVEWLFIIGLGLCLLQGFLGIQPLNFSGENKRPQSYENSYDKHPENAFRWDGE